MLEMRGSEGLKVRIKGIRLGLLASFVGVFLFYR